MTDKELNGEEHLSITDIPEAREPVNPLDQVPVEEPKEPVPTEPAEVAEEPIIDKERELEASRIKLQEAEGYQQKNFAYLREKNEELVRKLALYEQMQEEAKKPIQEAIDDEDYVSGKQYKQDLATIRQETEMIHFRTLMASRYNDFYNVMTEDNIKKYMEKDPATVTALNNSSDWKSATESLYGHVKTFITPAKVNVTKQEKKIVENSTKPRSASSLSAPIPDSAIAEATSFMDGDAYEERRRALWEQTKREANSFF